MVQHRRLNQRVGQDVDQHRGVRHKLGMNHAGAFADRGDADFLFELARTSDLGFSHIEAREGGLLDRVGGEDSLCELLEVVGLRSERCGYLRQGCDELFRREAGRR